MQFTAHPQTAQSDAPRCFTKPRNESSNVDVSPTTHPTHSPSSTIHSLVQYFARLVEDYQSALGYSKYLEGVMEQYQAECEDVHTPYTYCGSLNQLNTAVDTLKRSLGNLVSCIS